MTDINKLIEEEKKLAIKDRWSYYNYSDDPTYAYREGYESGIDKGIEIVLHQNRWRKVEEEMPEYRDNDYQVLGLLNNGEYKTIWVIKDSIPQTEVFAYHGVAEWKPIS